MLRPQSQPIGSTVELDPEVEGLLELVEELGLVLWEGPDPEVAGPALKESLVAMLAVLAIDIHVAIVSCDHDACI